MSPTIADSFLPGHVVAANLAPQAIAAFEPVLRKLLVGTQDFVKQPDGRWRPRGCSLGFCGCFEFGQLELRE
jgi:hypothetical protein